MPGRRSVPAMASIFFDQRAERVGLEEDARELWMRARRELARRFAVGYLGRGMTVPAWSPEELDADDDDEDDDSW